jgi:hypothetical protein
MARTILTMAAALLVGATAARAQISPGPLAKPHAQLEGAENCLECHAGGAASLDDNCLACHREIRWLVDHRRGLHGIEADKNCAGCHPDHAGRGFEMVEWDGGAPSRFDHERAGWSLTGAHARVACRDCHDRKKHSGPVPGLWKRADPGDTWLGLEGDCATCHEDEHRGTLGDRCADCHDTAHWKPAPGFDHAATSYPLTGKHATTPCERCHLVPERVFVEGPDGRVRARYKPVEHAECSACHADLHRGRLGPACASCHVTEGFAIVDPAHFDHARTRYPLRGRHASVQCGECHDPARGGAERPEFATCGACHKDAHAGTATLAGRAVDCAACHDERGFDRSTYTAANHAESLYPLAGRHATVACRSCHAKDAKDAALGTAAVRLRPRFATCRDCHVDAHGGQLVARANHGACETCHTVDAWRPSTYGPAEHASLQLSLEGRHAEATCAACHGPLRPGLPALAGADVLGSARVAFAIPVACETCHVDPHEGRFSAGGARPAPGGCRDCHDTVAFHPSRVDAASHDAFGYALAGAHRAVPCVECHRALREPPPRIVLLRVEGKKRSLLFTEPHADCVDCHRTPHGDQFDARPGGCAACHGLLAFRPADLFDHETQARFRLAGAHRNVPCGRCHPRKSLADGAEVVVYRPLPFDCRDCHAPASRALRGAS